MGPTKGKDGFYLGASLRYSQKALALASLFLCFVAFGLCQLTYAETFIEKCEKLKDQLAKTDCDELKKFSQALEKFLKIKKDAEHLSVSVNAGYTGDVSTTDKRQLINLDSTVEKDIYPITLRFKAGAIFSSKPNQSQDQTTSFLVNLDYHVLPWLETYGFVERFTDTFMSIKERYETGGGIKFELDALNPKEGDETKDLYEKKTFIEDELPKAVERLQSALERWHAQQCLKDAGIEAKTLDEFIDSLRIESGNLKNALKMKRSKISLCLAVTVMSEMEQADISADVLDVNTGQTVRTLDYLPGPTQRFRLVLRPSFNYKIDERLSLSSQVYFKEPLGRPIFENGKRDWRYDGVINAKFDLLKDTSWGGDVSVTIEYQRHYDNVPPFIPAQKIPELITSGQTLSKTVADNRHEVALVKIGVKF